MVKGAEIFQFFVDFSAFLYYSVCVKGNHVYTIQGGLFRRTGGMSCENNPNPLLHRHPGPPRGGGKPEGGGHRQNAPLQGRKRRRGAGAGGPGKPHRFPPALGAGEGKETGHPGDQRPHTGGAQ